MKTERGFFLFVLALKKMVDIYLLIEMYSQNYLLLL